MEDDMKLSLTLHLGKFPDGEFSRVHAILLTNDGRTLLRYKEGVPRLTGGRIDAGEDVVEALKREIMEELNCEVDLCDYLGYTEISGQARIKFELEESDRYWARMVARVSKILPPRPDPDRTNNWIYGRILAPREIAYEELGQIPLFGKNNKHLLDEAYKIAREKSYFTELPNMEYEVLNVESRDMLA